MDAAQREILAANLKRVRERIAAACARVKRDPKEVTLIAVTKTVGPEVIQALIELGVTDIGENKLQAAHEKFPKVPALRDRTKVKRHFIGHLQTNKVKGVLELFDVIHSVDSVKLAEEIDKRARQLLPREPPSCFLELNLAGEESKSGIQFSDKELRSVANDKDFTVSIGKTLIDAYYSKPRCLRWAGLMAMAPADPAIVGARQLFQYVFMLSTFLIFAVPSYEDEPWCLSMGMSNDFEIAIEEGATHVRIGTALFEGLAP